MTFFGYDGADIPRCWNSPRSRALSAPVSRSAARSASSRAHSCGRRRLVRSALAALLLGCSASVLPGVVLAQVVGLGAEGIETMPASVMMGEEESQASVGVTLSLEPSINRTVMMTNSDPGAVTVSPGSLTFTPTNWNVEQFFNITPVQDADTNDESVRLTLSGDELTSKTVTVEVRDDDTQGIVLSEDKDTVAVGESDQAIIGVTLSALPTGNLQVDAVSGDPGAVTVSPGSLTFTSANWNQEQRFNIIPVQDDDTNDESVTLTLSGTGLTSKTVTVAVRDDDTQGIVLSEDKDTVAVGESDQASVGVTLSALPTGNLQVDAVSGDPGAVTVSPGSLTFKPANWNQEQWFDIIPVQDDDTNDESVTLTLSGTGLTSKTVTVAVTDDDTAQVTGVTVDAGDAQLVVNWTAVDNATGYTVQWKSGNQGYNTEDRQATVTPGSTTSHTIEGLANGTVYTVRVIATRTDANDGPPSAEVTGTPEMIPMPSPTLPEIALLLLAMLLLGSGVYLLRGRQSGGLTHA